MCTFVCLCSYKHSFPYFSEKNSAQSKIHTPKFLEMQIFTIKQKGKLSKYFTLQLERKLKKMLKGTVLPMLHKETPEICEKQRKNILAIIQICALVRNRHFSVQLQDLKHHICTNLITCPSQLPGVFQVFFKE